MALSQEMVQPELMQTPEGTRRDVKDGRGAPRFPMVAAVCIGWVDTRRQMTYRTARGVDISETGLGLRVPTPLTPSTLVHLELANCGISAVGHVKYCMPVGGEWRVGVEVTASFPSGGAEPVELELK